MPRTKFARRLKPGSVVQIVAPSDPLTKLSNQEITASEQYLCSLGLEVEYGNSAKKGDQSIDGRCQDLYEAFANPKIGLVLAAAGGYIESELIAELKFKKLRGDKKFFCGYSDNTVLVAALHKALSVSTLYGPNFSSFSQREGSEYTRKYFEQLLFSSQAFSIQPSFTWFDKTYAVDNTVITSHKNHGWKSLGPVATVEGQLVVGHLGSLLNLAAVKLLPDLTSKILAIEIDSETSISQLQSQLGYLSGVVELSKLAGMLFGRMPTGSNISLSALENLIVQNTSLKNLPIIVNVDFGHTTPRVTLPYGGTIIMRSQIGNESIRVVEH
ncbi:LD-carboxypeptidase [Candidatus Saccharibacteria bacterium]|jgi:muramoyltetrapeptide carboxypeptidase|nr:LD-carboxypeptidase [Candidatus Saccharibacteria bacterium]